MKVFIGADHRGYALKEKLKMNLEAVGNEVVDVGNERFDENDDYADFAIKMGEMGNWGEGKDRGVLICGTGEGMAMVVNKIEGVRAALCWNSEVARLAREHEDANVLCLPADYLGEMQALGIMEDFLKTEFSGEERHKRRVEKIETMGGS